MTRQEPTRDPLATLMRRNAELDDAEAQVAKQAFLERVDRELPKHGEALRKPVYYFAPLAVAAAVLLVVLLWPSQKLTFEIAGAASDGGYVQAESAPATIEFSDDTSVEVAPGARLRVVEVTRDGARVSLERGGVSVEVTHTESSNWRFNAGPFEVHVTGTRFDLDWDPQTERVQLDLHEGSVEVRGYQDAGPLRLRAGQTFLGDARARTMQMIERDSTGGEAAGNDEPRDGARDAEVALAPEGQTENAQPPSTDAKGQKSETISGSSSPASQAPWSELVSKARFSDVVEAAQRRGIAACLSSCSASDLGALADAARYTGRNDLAQNSLLSLRKRFSSGSGVRAAFLLGRLYEGQGQHSKARTWYETSLRESPSGAYAGESLAGKMRVTLVLRGRSAAQPIAKDYLKRYPEGVHADAARKLTEP